VPYVYSLAPFAETRPLCWAQGQKEWNRVHTGSRNLAKEVLKRSEHPPHSPLSSVDRPVLQNQVGVK
jgi:hypothetical protein